ncbi:MAG: class I SAM-dependent methyltransferase [Actinobacteria bacterium]|nr:class I SAM-dependent methyltransferase [Actinomycetota bacterium]MBV8958577.1 class I SAM-dependent methyltransferase [Actinomycetota bacterium]
MRKVDYDERLHAVYAKGRVMSPAALATWMEAFTDHLQPERPLALLDLGSGIGRFTPWLAEAFGGPVFGVEPSVRMREIAEADARHDRVTYLDGRGEAIPLPDRSCDAALIYFVWHHIEDRAAAARELARVVKPGGRLLVRTNFADAMPELWWYRYFPRAREVDRMIYEPRATVYATFESAGWDIAAHDVVDFETASSRAEDFERIQLRALSTFEHLDEQETKEGFAAIADALAAGEEPDGPLVMPADLLVLSH